LVPNNQWITISEGLYPTATKLGLISTTRWFPRWRRPPTSQKYSHCFKSSMWILKRFLCTLWYWF